MIGKQKMRNIPSRCMQATPAHRNRKGHPLGNNSIVAVGDPAQCLPPTHIRDVVRYDEEAHRDTQTNPAATRVIMTNQGLHSYYSTFDEVVMLQQCHRIHQRKGEDLSSEDVACNERGQRFLAIMGRLRDCKCTEEDYYRFCRRKFSRLSMTERASFMDAFFIVGFRRKERDDGDAQDNSEAYN